MSTLNKIDLLVGFLSGLSNGNISYEDTGAWHKERLTRDDYESLLVELSHDANADIIDLFNSLRRDWLPSASTLIFRLPPPSHTAFAQSLQTALSNQLSALAPRLAALANIDPANAELDDGGTVLGAHSPDACFYFDTPSADADAHARRHDACPTVVLEVCDAAKAADMGALAQRYMWEGRPRTRVVVAVDVAAGTYSVWRNIRVFPRAIGGREYWRCVLGVDRRRWLGADGRVVPGTLALQARDFLPRGLPRFEGVEEKREVAAVLREEVRVEHREMAELWGCAVWDEETRGDEEEDDEEGSMDMDLDGDEWEDDDDEEI